MINSFPESTTLPIIIYETLARMTIKKFKLKIFNDIQKSICTFLPEVVLIVTLVDFKVPVSHNET